jgi:hypothetical protein
VKDIRAAKAIDAKIGKEFARWYRLRPTAKSSAKPLAVAKTPGKTASVK